MSAQLYGIAAEFATPEAATRAAGEARAQGFRRIEAYGPYPVPELAEASGFRERRIAPAVLAGAILGGLGGYGFLYYATVLAYPHNIGGRPLNSWPSFLPITFECTVLCATFAGIGALLFLSRLPRLAHPVFAIPGFRRASRDRFFVCIRAQADADFDAEAAERALRAGEPLAVHRVEEES
jgi:hypothetical protein